MQIENYCTNPTISSVNIDGLDTGNEKGEFNIISNELKKIIPKTEIEQNTESNKNNPNYMKNLLQNKNDPKIKKRLNLISSLDNLENIDYNTCFTEGNIIDRENNTDKKSEIKSFIAKKLVNGNNNKIRKIMDQTSTLFDNKIYSSNYSGKNYNTLNNECFLIFT